MKSLFQKSLLLKEAPVEIQPSPVEDTAGYEAHAKVEATSSEGTLLKSLLLKFNLLQLKGLLCMRPQNFSFHQLWSPLQKRPQLTLSLHQLRRPL